MTEVVFQDHSKVELIDSMGDDDKIAFMARGSLGNGKGTPESNVWLIRGLITEGHKVPFEHCAMTFRIETPIFVSRQLVKHRHCLSGRTRLNRRTANGSGVRSGLNETIAEIWERWHVGSHTVHRNGKEFWRPLSASKDVYLDCLNEQTGELEIGKVKDVIKTGVQETWLVTFKNNKSLRSTMGHRYWTPSGWRKLSELKPGDLVAREGKIPVVDGGAPFIPRPTRVGIQAWTSAMKKRDVVGMTECHVCHEVFPPDEIEYDHIVPVVEDLTKALDLKNLAPACTLCHRAKTASEQPQRGARSKRGLRWEMIDSIDDPRSEETYDIEMSGEHHNFLAEGFVVHNSSISELSGRYTELPSKFYIPSVHRPLGQEGKRMEYKMVPLSEEGEEGARATMRCASDSAAREYQYLLSMGVSREVARMVLPVNTFTELRMTVNLLSLMNILHLRMEWSERGLDWTDTKPVKPGHPQFEIQEVADEMGHLMAEKFPATFQAFADNGFII